jgi:lysylphosphatidylglycerol synthetase-like protein (DUF2156 family)
VPGGTPTGTGVVMTAEEQLADRLVRIVVVVFFLKAAGFLLLLLSASFRTVSGRSVAVALVLAAALVVVGIGLLQGRRWAWPLALVVLVVDALLVESVLRWLIDLGLALVLSRPQVRARFGIR